MIDLEKWTGQKIKVVEESFIGTKRDCIGKGEFVVNIIMQSVMASSIKYKTDVDAENAEKEIWKEFQREG